MTGNASDRLCPPSATIRTQNLSGDVNADQAQSSSSLAVSPSTKSLAGDTLRSRSNSFNSTLSDADTSRSRANSDLQSPHNTNTFEGADLPEEEVLAPDAKNAKDFEVANNPFAYTPGQLNRLLNPKNLAAYRALGGVQGIAHGLQTDLLAGLSVDEAKVDKVVTFAEARNAASNKASMVHARPSSRSNASPEVNTTEQFQDRKAVFKTNRLPAKNAVSIWRMFWNAAKDKILILLTIAAIISLALGIYEAVGQVNAAEEGPSLDWVEGVAIEVAVVIVILVTGLNDYRREKQFAALNAKKDDRQVKAIRSGHSSMISVFDIMVGDILHLESGDFIPADGILVDGHGIRCDESTATGESDAMRKITGLETWKRIQSGTADAKSDPFLISGSKVLEGVGTYVVTSVGIHSSHGKIMMSLQTATEETPLQIKLSKMANWIGYLGISAATLLFVILSIRFIVGLPNNPANPAVKGSQYLDILIVAVTIIVVAVPEGLPLAVTLALSFATKKMLKENNLVRHLRACETMGNATTICSDKTGTLTQNQMTVVEGVLGSTTHFARYDDTAKEHDVSPIKQAFGNLAHDVKNLILQSCAINSTAFEGEEDGKPTYIGSKTETAILTMAKEQLGMGPVAEERAGVEIVQLIPFDSDRKCMGVVIRLASGSYRLLVKGAAEILLENAASIIGDLTSEHIRPQDLTSSAREALELDIQQYAKRSLRTIAFTYRDYQQWPPQGCRSLDEDAAMLQFEDIFQDMVFLALVGIQDPLRVGVTEAVQQCQAAGVVVRMVTGDNVTTAAAIATQCGIKTAGGLVMEGPQFRNLSDAEMDRIIPDLQVLARSSPEDKRILVARLKHGGETVAVTGDGTNDGPALKLADVGFSMGITGTEVAKEASDIILMDDNFTSIVKAIMWGRSVNDAVAKFLQFQITVNITAVILAFVSAVSSPDMHSVLSAVQLLWVNLIMDTFAALALATDPPTVAILDRRPAPKSAPLITTNMWKMILGQAVYQLAVTFTLYFAGARILGYPSGDALRKTELATIVFNTFVWMQIFNQFNNRRLDNKFNIFVGILRNPFFIAISTLMIAGQVMIIFVGGAAFQIKRIDGTQWAICILSAMPCLLWAMVLRTIPDRYAAIFFHYSGIVWSFFYRPVAKIVKILIVDPFKRCFGPFKRCFGRFKRSKKSDKTDSDAEKDGEIEPTPVQSHSQIQPDEELALHSEKPTVTVSPPQTASQLETSTPGITLTRPS